jgi:DNA-damage-inducible protein J
MELQGVFAMATDTTVRARIDARVKKKAAHVLEDMGLSLSDAIRLMLLRVAAEKALPFDVKVPNAATTRTLRKAAKGEDLTRSKNAADLFGKLGI